jgi:hypothetical protein
MEKNFKLEEENNTKENQKQKHNKILRNFLIFLAVAILVYFVIGLIASNAKTIEYRGVKFEITKEIAPYKTDAVISQKDAVTGSFYQAPYSYYMRTNPFLLDKIPFEGNLKLMKVMVINSSDPFNCEGQGILGMTNLVRLLSSIGVSVIKDPKAGCDTEGKYLFLNIEKGNETKIVETNQTCYTMYINNCEVLKATERFMLESLVEMNKYIDSNQKNKTLI